MVEPKISWLVRTVDTNNASDFVEDSDYFAGTYTKQNPFSIEVMVWNNRHGADAVDDLKDFSIVVEFEDLEDSTLLKYMTFVLNDSEILNAVINNNVAELAIPQDIILSGEINDGSTASHNNYLTLKMTLNVPQNKKIKMNDIKTMMLSIGKM